LYKQTFKAFQSREFRLMWSGACVSSIGSWMQNLAQSWLVFSISGKASYLGLDTFLGQIPIFMFSLVGGVVADRMDRRHLLLISQFIQMSCALTLTTLLAFGVIKVWHILCISFVTGTAQAFGGPAYSALLPTLVPREDMPNAIALNSVQFNVARVLGPMLGGIALTQLGAAWCFGLNGLSFVAVIITLILVRSNFTPVSDKRPMLESMKQGIIFIRSKESMGSLVILAFLMTMMGLSLMTFLPVFTKNVFNKGPETLSVLLTGTGLGAITGSLIIATFHNTKRKGLLALLMIVVAGICTTGFAWSTNLYVSLTFLFLGSAALMTVFAMVASLVQLITEDNMRGRVMSVYNMAFRGGNPFGGLVNGNLIQNFGAPLIVGLNGVLLTGLGLYYLLVQKKVSRL
jgi:predicted MFS family arabinose efflux permease